MSHEGSTLSFITPPMSRLRRFAQRVACLVASLLISVSLSAWSSEVSAEPHQVKTHRDENGWRLLVNGQPMMVFGMNWGYIPIGQNYSWVLWQQPEEVIEEALRAEMSLLREMGVNAIRQYPDIPPKWVEWIYQEYQIFTVINHTLGRYGALVEGSWIPETDYAHPATRAALLAELRQVTERYQNTPGVLMYLLGNENNYGLSWTSFEAEDLPQGEVDNARAQPLYTLFGEAATLIKGIDSSHPVAIANGDLGYLDLIVKHCQSVDILASNVYRGASSRDLFDRVARELDRPFMYSEFGADAFNARLMREDSLAQAEYLRRQWQELYEHSHGKGRSGVSIGGLIFQWSDGWWKYRQVERLDLHDQVATWGNEGYPHDYVEGQPNMNEEWFGIAAKGPPDERGIFSVRPRPAYYLLQRAFTLPPYDAKTTLPKIKAHFDSLNPRRFSTPYTAESALAETRESSRVKVSRLRLLLESGLSRGSEGTTRSQETVLGNTQSAYVDVSAQPNSKVSARVSFNLLGQVAQNRLNPIFYENRGRSLRGDSTASSAGAASSPSDESVDLSSLERVAIYQSEFEVDESWFNLRGFYRVGHYHWGDEGDIFGLYPEAYYGPNIDIYNANAPLGAVMSGKKSFKHWKFAFGPQLYWGANPGFIVKYHRTFGDLSLSLIHHEDIGQNAETGSSNALPIRQSRRTALSLGYRSGAFRLDLGGLFSGSDRVGERFLWTEETRGRGYRDTGLLVHDDEVQWLDTLGGKARVTYMGGRWNAYLQGIFKGLVSAAGADPRQRFTGWSLNESGNGNQIGGLAGVSLNLGSFQVAPHFLYQRPLIGPMDTVDDLYNPSSGIYYPALRARNQLDDPFAVLDNRETIAGELLLSYDPTPGTWLWQWDNALKEDAPFAASINLIYRHLPTSRDARFGVNERGQFFAFDGAPPAQDLWEVKGRWVSRVSSRLRLIGTFFAGEAQSRGIDDRVITRYGGDLWVIGSGWNVKTSLAFDDWGPYDYHRDYHLTYPLQASADLGYILGFMSFDKTITRFGLRGLYRSLDEHSEGYDVRVGGASTNAHIYEWEVISYVRFDL